MKAPVLVGLLLAVSTAIAVAAAVQDREGAVRQDRSTMENDPRWIYNDYEKGVAEAKRTGKPLLVVLRCVPCLSCMGLDAGVLSATDLAPLLDQFVCVRLINANALDLSRFQFDYDLSLSALFFNADGTVYGRYGSWTHQKDPKDKTTAGLKRALDAVQAIHAGYPANKASLADKQGLPMPFQKPVEIPSLSRKYQLQLDWTGKVLPSCVHCHQIGDAVRGWYREQGKPVPTQWVYPMPMPETIGLTLEPDQIARVKTVAPGSVAAQAGLAPADDIIALEGQKPISVADVSWALHRAPDAGSLAVRVKRADGEKTLALSLPTGWRSHSDISRRVGTWEMRALTAGGMVLLDLTDEERAQRGLAKDKLALLVKSVGQYGKHAAAKKAGFQKGDVIIQLADHSTRLTEGELIGQLLQTTRAGEQLKATVLRSEQRVELTLPMQ